MNTPIKRHSSLIKLSREHHSGLLLSMLLKKDSPQYRDMPETNEEKMLFLKNSYDKELKFHFNEEEQILFPYVIGRTEEIDGLIEQLIEEHISLIKNIESVEQKTDLVLALDEIGRALELHIRKEERQLFEKIQSSFSEEELTLLGQKLNTKSGS